MAKIVETNDEWITTRTGIQHRHHCTTESHTFLCVNAAKSALEKAGVTPDEIGACIVATVTGDNIVPSAACMLQRSWFGRRTFPALTSTPPHRLFVCPAHHGVPAQRLSPEIRSGSGCRSSQPDHQLGRPGHRILFGDGAGAAVVECREGWPSISAVMGSRGDDELLRLPGIETGERGFISMEGTKVFKFAVEAVPACMDAVLKKTGKTVEDVDFFVFHQANARIIDLAVRKYHIPPEKYYKNISEYGNTAAASIPLVLSELQDQGRIGPGAGCW